MDYFIIISKFMNVMQIYLPVCVKGCAQN